MRCSGSAGFFNSGRGCPLGGVARLALASTCSLQLPRSNQPLSECASSGCALRRAIAVVGVFPVQSPSIRDLPRISSQFLKLAWQFLTFVLGSFRFLSQVCED